MNKILHYNYIEEFVDDIVDNIVDDEDLLVTVIAKFDEAKEILKNIMVYDVDFETVQIESPLMDNYNDEFVISLWRDDEFIEVGCEKVKNKKGEYLDPWGDVVYLFPDCSSKILPLLKDTELYIVDVADECGCLDESCCKCQHDCCSKNEENAVAETDTAKSYYAINGKPVSKDEFEKKCAEMRVKYEEITKRMFYDHLLSMSDLDDILARLW